MDAYFAARSEVTRTLKVYLSSCSIEYRHFVIKKLLPLVIAVGIVVMVASVHYPVYAQQAPITCTNTVISPPLTEDSINPSSIVGSVDGQLVYLVSNYDSDTSRLFHVAPDDKLTEMGQLDNLLGVYGFPRWNVDIEARNIIFTSYIGGDYGIPTTIMLMNLDDGEQTTFMSGVNEYDFGRAAGYIWWSSNEVSDPGSDYGFHLYDATTDTISTMLVPELMPESLAISGHLVQMQPNGDVLFMLTRLPADSNGSHISYYRGDPRTGTSHLFLEEEVNDGPFTPFDEIAILEDRAAYISDEGHYIEIDFEGGQLHSIPLFGSGFYRALRPTPTGMLFMHDNPDDTDGPSLYHVSRSGVLSNLIPLGDNLQSVRLNTMVITAPDAATTLWLNTIPRSGEEPAMLHVYALPTDDTIAINEPVLVVEDVVEFYSSPTGAYVVANMSGEAVLINTTTFNQSHTNTDFKAKSVYFDGDQPYSIHQGRVQFVDTTQDIVYYSPTFPPQDDYVLVATTYDDAEPVQVTLPDVHVPFSLHWNAFNLMPDGHIVYTGDDLQTLYRARCQRDD